MKTIKSLTVLFILLLTFNCSSDDDSNNNEQQTTEDLLTSGKWYQESQSPGSFSECEKNGSLKFNTDNTLVIESYDDESGTCELEGIVNAAYSLSGNTITITISGDTIIATINSISESTLNVTDDEGNTVVFDKTQG